MLISPTVIVCCSLARLVSIVDNEWRLGLAACKMTEYLTGITIINNILTLTAIAIDR